MRQLKLLGPARVELINTNKESGESQPGTAPRFRSRYSVALLGYLTVEQRAVDRDTLALLLRPDVEPGKGRSYLRRELYNLTQILPGCWQTDAQTIHFLPDSDTIVDIHLLGQLEQKKRWQDAADILGGEFLEGLFLDDNIRFETWLLAERRRWRERSRVILAGARDVLTRHGQYLEALSYGRRLVQLAPWNEEAHREVMRLLAWTDQRAAALKQYAICKQDLAEHLAVEPAAETLALWQQIKEGRLAAPPSPPAFLAISMIKPDTTAPFFVARTRELNWLRKALDHAQSGPGGIVFLTGGPGRGKTALMDAFARLAMEEIPELLVAAGSSVVGALNPYGPFRDVMAMLTGDVEARWSSGKISSEHARRLWDALPFTVQVLLEHGPHLLHILLTGKTLLRRAQAVEPCGAPWLLDLQEQVQELGSKTAELQQSHLFEQLTNVLRVIAEKRPLLLLLDDIQWMDASSIGLLSHLGQRLTYNGGKMLIVCAYRPEEAFYDSKGERHLLAKVLGELKRSFGEVWLNLNWADIGEAQGFVNAVLDSMPNRLEQRFRDALFELTTGHPLFTIELLRDMQERGDLIKDADGQWREGSALNWQLLPARVEAVIEERIGRLPSALQRTLTVASVEGESFTVEVLAHVQNISQQRLLGHLAQDLAHHHRLVREREEVTAGRQILSRYQFSHILFQRYLYDSLGTGERRWLHGAIAQALEDLYEGQSDEQASRLAHHFLAAGNRKKAIEYAHQAARRAQALYAHEEAIQHLKTALDLLETGERIETQVGLLEDLAAVSGEFLKDIQALSYYQTALSLCSGRVDVDDMIVLRLHRKMLETALALYHNVEFDALNAWSQTLTQSRAYLEARLPLARRDQPQLEWVRVLTTLANFADVGAQPSVTLNTAEGYAQTAVEMAQQLDALEELSDALEVLGKVYYMRGRLPAQLQTAQQRLALSRDPRFDDPLKQIYILESLSDALIAVGEYTQALHYLSEKEEIAIQIGAVAAQIWALGLQALCLLHLDRWEEIFRLDEKRQELEQRYSINQIGGGNCVVLSICAAAHALQGDLDQAQAKREKAFAFMTRGGWDSTEDWERTQYY